MRRRRLWARLAAAEPLAIGCALGRAAADARGRGRSSTPLHATWDAARSESVTAEAKNAGTEQGLHVADHVSGDSGTPKCVSLQPVSSSAEHIAGTARIDRADTYDVT